MKKLFIIALVMLFISSTVFAGTFKADAKTKRIAAGTLFELEFIQPVGTFAGNEGDSFSAMLKNEIKTGNSVILPLGSIIRGSVSTIKTSKRFSRGAMLYLDFDHVVTPNGRQIPIDLSVARCNDKIYYDGGLYNNLGYGEAIKENYEKGVDITKRSTNYGLSVGDDHPGLQFITTPFCAVGGFIGGVGYLIGDSVADMFRKGKEVIIQKGDVITVQLINPIDIPVY